MQYTPEEFKRVHVVQSTYLANGPLSVGIENFMKPGVTLPRVLFLASKQTGLEHIDYFDGNVLKALNAAQRSFSRRNETLRLGRNIRIKKLADGALRFQAIPVDLVAFQQGLDVVDELPNIPTKFIGPQRHYLQLKIAAHLVGSEEQARFAAKKFREAMDHGLYSVQPNALVERVMEVLINPPARVEPNANTL